MRMAAGRGRREDNHMNPRKNGAMNETTAMWPGFELNIARDVQFVEPGGNELNPEWKHVDCNGHGHFVSLDKDDRLPTLVWISEPCTMGHDDCDAEGHYECRTCGEEIRPGTRPAAPLRIEGPTVYTLTVHQPGLRTTYRFGQQEWDALQDAIASDVRSTLADFLVEMQQTGPC